MNRTDELIRELESLPETELTKVYQALAAAHKAKVRQTVNQVVGKGAGIWDTDAQVHITALREDDRP